MPLSLSPFSTFLRRSFNLGFRGAWPGIIGRQYHSYRALISPPHAQVTSLADVRSAIDRNFEVARRQGLLDPSPGTMRMVVGPEFALNGGTAANPISIDLYREAVRYTQEKIAECSPGVLVSFGTAAVDTGQVLDDGKRLGENRGALVLSGVEHTVEFTKGTASGIDGWAYDRFMVPKGDGPKLFSFPDPEGGRPIVLGVATCLDWKFVADGRVSFPMTPDLVFVPAAGVPFEVRQLLENQAHILIADARDNPLVSELPQRDPMTGFELNPEHYKTGVYTRAEVEAHPFLASFVRVLGDWVESLPDYFRAAFALLSPTMETWTNKIEKYDREGLEKFSDGYHLTAELKLPELEGRTEDEVRKMVERLGGGDWSSVVEHGQVVDPDGRNGKRPDDPTGDPNDPHGEPNDPEERKDIPNDPNDPDDPDHRERPDDPARPKDPDHRDPDEDPRHEEDPEHKRDPKHDPPHEHKRDHPRR